ncbi:hypothetical protein ANN_07740 [Periplaneta americana]|uniref:DUF4817 domain-containing protein n=1 Tax=Periplaneta americana TaxID=6978 RepID=A0ABQ8T115_PERAM|nr:hypothetical protein ANN_07740 [Periplaneta americana]
MALTLSGKLLLLLQHCELFTSFKAAVQNVDRHDVYKLQSTLKWIWLQEEFSQRLERMLQAITTKDTIVIVRHFDGVFFTVKTYWKINSLIHTQRAFRREYGVRNVPNRPTKF